ncbi:MAG TPA: hypothetical protein VGC42_21505 [Kofleriaceae bacterium]
MRFIIGLLVGVLLLIAFAGLGLGVVFVAQAVDAASADLPANILAALGLGAVPFAIGTVALGGAVVTLAVDQARTEIVNALLIDARPPDEPAAPAAPRTPDRNAGDWR